VQPGEGGPDPEDVGVKGGAVLDKENDDLSQIPVLGIPELAAELRKLGSGSESTRRQMGPSWPGPVASVDKDVALDAPSPIRIRISTPHWGIHRKPHMITTLLAYTPDVGDAGTV
jgi:hypothetical protein